MSFYLKYRPQNVNDLDLTNVREFLERTLSCGEVTHAYLFTGPRGTGKTSAARILAKVVNCNLNVKRRKKAMSEPCNKCINCKAITDGSLVDLIEIDAASNRGIDDIRNLKEKIKLSPAAASKKVYIIDEVHMLTVEAFNALLKTLEEPPKHAIFVLATTEAHKIPETIVSRCVRLVFPKANSQEVVRSLKKAVKGEKLKVKKQALEEIAKYVDGSFREGMKILEQLSLNKKMVTEEMVKKELNRSGSLDVLKLLNLMKDKKQKQALIEIERLNKLGVDFKVLVGQALEKLRMTLLKQVGIEIDEKEGVVEDLSREDGLRLIELFIRVSSQMKQIDLAHLPWEIGVIEWCCAAKDVQKVKVPERELSKSGIVNKGEVASKTQVVNEGKVLQNKGVVKIEDIKSRWEEVLKAVRPHNHSLEGLLRSTRPIGINGNLVSVEVFYQFHLDQLSQVKFMQIVEKEVAGLFDVSLKLEYHLGSRPQKKVEEVENIVATNDEDIAAVAEEIFGN